MFIKIKFQLEFKDVNSDESFDHEVLNEFLLRLTDKINKEI